ncbi:unnamed protein product [Litomosoides sigmodontis]|uniref:Uncharacterized protein n=1 Tax=Litomosoides sigmodontis TaxID=42156 RepID=A0A3P6TZG0_LITSI|nr:unnamed protein product [Litomosoides sigmodontis]
MSGAKVAQIRRKHKGRKRPGWNWLERIIANFWNPGEFFNKLLKRIKRIFTYTFAFVPLRPKENVDDRRCRSLDNHMNCEKAEMASVEESATVEEQAASVCTLAMNKVGVQASDQSITSISCEATKLVDVREVNKHLVENLSDFIFNDSYFEDSWGLHSDLLLSTYIRQVNAFLPASFTVTASWKASAEMSKQSIRVLKAVHLQGMEDKREVLRFIGGIQYA